MGDVTDVTTFAAVFAVITRAVFDTLITVGAIVYPLLQLPPDVIVYPVIALRVNQTVAAAPEPRPPTNTISGVVDLEPPLYIYLILIQRLLLLLLLLD